MHDEYITLLESLADSDWKRKSGNAAWTVGQLMWHLAWGAGHFPDVVEACRKGKAPNPPRWLMNPANVLITRLGSRKATQESVAESYEAAHAAILACLAGIRDNEWQKGAQAYGRYSTIETSFARLREHFDEHNGDILRGLGRAQQS